jgi:hypothetical protein
MESSCGVVFVLGMRTIGADISNRCEWYCHLLTEWVKHKARISDEGAQK